MMDDTAPIRRLRVTGAIAIVCIAIVTASLAALLAWRHFTAPVQSDIINASGLRRGQSVAVLYRAERLVRFPNETAELNEAIEKLENSEQSMNDLSSENHDFYDRFIALARSIVVHPHDLVAIDQLEAMGPQIYAIFYDRTVGYTSSNGTYRNRTFYTTMAGMGITLLVLALLYVFVIRPTEGLVITNMRELEERRERFAALFDNSTEMMAVYDLDGRIMRANAAAAERLGFGTDTVGKTWEIHVAEADRHVVARAFAQAGRGKAGELGVSFIDSSGRELPVLANLAPIVVAGKTVGVAGTARDISTERDFERELVRGRQRFRSLFEISQNAIIAFTPEGIITEANVAMERVSGFRADDMIGKHFTNFLPPEYRERALERLTKALEGEAHTYRLELLTRAGTSVALDAEVIPIRIGGNTEGFFMIGKDLTREEALQRLDQRDARMRALYQLASSPDVEAGTQIDDALALGAEVLDMEYGSVGQIVSGVVTIRYRFGPDDLLKIGDSFPATPAIGERIFASPHAVARADLTVEPYASELSQRGLPWKSYIGCRLVVDRVPYGSLAFMSRRVRRTNFDQSDRDFIDLLAALIGSALGRARLQMQLRDMAFHDSLTGLANRALLEEYLARSIAQSQRSHDLVAVHYLDLNRFKPVNDEYGHAAGDLVLREAARRFSAAVRGGDVVARIGGDEFVVLQPAIADEGPIRALAQRLRGAMNDPIALGNGVNVNVGVSVGTAVYPIDAREPAMLLRLADGAMYREKSQRIQVG